MWSQLCKRHHGVLLWDSFLNYSLDIYSWKPLQFIAVGKASSISGSGKRHHSPHPLTAVELFGTVSSSLKKYRSSQSVCVDPLPPYSPCSPTCVPFSSTVLTLPGWGGNNVKVLVSHPFPGRLERRKETWVQLLNSWINIIQTFSYSRASGHVSW